MRCLLVLCFALSSWTPAFAQDAPPVKKDTYYTGVLQKVRMQGGRAIFDGQVTMTFMLGKPDGSLVTDDPVDPKPVTLKKTATGWKGELPGNGIVLLARQTHAAQLLVIDVQAQRGGQMVGGIRFYLTRVSAERYKELRSKAMVASKVMPLLRNLGQALREYESDYGKYPESGDANLGKFLDGDDSNGGPKKLYFEFRKGQLDAKGAVLDPWGNAVRYTRDDKAYGFRLQSFGPNGKDDGGKGDDVILSHPPK